MNHERTLTERENAQWEVQNHRALRDLCEVVARRARTKGICFTDRNEICKDMMKDCHPEMEVMDLSLFGERKPGAFRNVVLLQVLENLEADSGEKLLRKCWSLLKEKGRLIVVVPNENVFRHPHQVREFKRQHLKRALEPLGKPKMITEQPFKWLAMVVEKRNGNRSRVHAIRKKRVQTTAKLCRGDVVEFGCGRGELANEIKRKGLSIIGIDKNAEKIRQAKETYPDIIFYQMDVLRMSLPPAAFDTVVLAEIHEHVTDKMGDKMLEIAWQRLRPNGRLIVSVPNEHAIPNPNHIRQFSRQSLQNMLKPFGNPVLETDQPYKWLIMHVDKVA